MTTVEIEGEVQKFVGRLAGAGAAAEQAVAVYPDNPEVLTKAADLFNLVGEYDKAIDGLRRAASLRPNAAAPFYNLGMLQQFAGDLAGARASFERALRNDPTFFRAQYALVQMDKQSHLQNRIPVLEKLFAAPGADPDGDRALHLGHALGKTYEDLGDPETAMSWLKRAKAPRRQLDPYDFAGQQALFQAAAETWPPADPAPGHPSNEPIFVVGLPRTGTTLVERILASHPDVTSADELSHFPALVKLMTGTASGGLPGAEEMRRATGLDFARLGQAYVDSTRPLTGATPRFVDKLPLNALYAGLIRRALPNAKIVCLRRDPMDATLSIYRQMFFTRNHPYACSYDLEATARHVTLFERLAEHWRRTLPEDGYMELRYEDLVSDQEGRTRALLAFLGLPWDSRCLNFQETKGTVATPSAAQVRRGINDSSVGRWRKYGPLLAGVEGVIRRG